MDPTTNAHVAAQMLSEDLRKCHGRMRAALARYNRGHGCGDENGYGARVLTEVIGR
jgi:hypothetical protein